MESAKGQPGAEIQASKIRFCGLIFVSEGSFSGYEPRFGFSRPEKVSVKLELKKALKRIAFFKKKIIFNISHGSLLHYHYVTRRCFFNEYNILWQRPVLDQRKKHNLKSENGGERKS